MAMEIETGLWWGRGVSSERLVVLFTSQRVHGVFSEEGRVAPCARLGRVDGSLCWDARSAGMREGKQNKPTKKKNIRKRWEGKEEEEEEAVTLADVER
jgi:hypothetical protein